jgi:hypothetical protein
LHAGHISLQLIVLFTDLFTDRLHRNDDSDEIVRRFQPAQRTRIANPTHNPCQPHLERQSS